jgi:hypothetical protein
LLLTLLSVKVFNLLIEVRDVDGTGNGSKSLGPAACEAGRSKSTPTLMVAIESERVVGSADQNFGELALKYTIRTVPILGVISILEGLLSSLRHGATSELLRSIRCSTWLLGKFRA